MAVLVLSSGQAARGEIAIVAQQPPTECVGAYWLGRPGSLMRPPRDLAVGIGSDLPFQVPSPATSCSTHELSNPTAQHLDHAAIHPHVFTVRTALP